MALESVSVTSMVSVYASHLTNTWQGVFTVILIVIRRDHQVTCIYVAISISLGPMATPGNSPSIFRFETFMTMKITSLTEHYSHKFCKRLIICILYRQSENNESST